jgi:hypothetical protein
VSRPYRQKTNRVSAQAFKPRNPKPPDTIFKTSVYRTDGCLAQEIWSIGEDYVTKKRSDGRKVLARAEIVAETIFAEKLELTPAPSPHPRHADITAWPDQPEKRLEKASQLALTAQLFIP